MVRGATNDGPLLTFARILGFGAGIGTIILYGAALFFNAPARSVSNETDVYVVGAGICLLGLVAAWGALARKPVLLFVAFVVSFFPVGLYILGTESIFAAIGICHLLYVVAGIIMVIQRSRRGA